MNLKNRVYIKIFLALVLSPYVAALSYILMGYGFVFSELENLLGFTHLTASYAYPMAILVGLPGYFLLKRLNRLNFYFFALLIAVSAFALSHFVSLGGYRDAGDLGANIRAFVAGMIGAGVCWIIINFSGDDLVQGKT